MQPFLQHIFSIPNFLWNKSAFEFKTNIQAIFMKLDLWSVNICSNKTEKLCNCSFFYLDLFREHSLLYESKGKDHVPSTSQKPGLTRLYKKILFIVYVNNVHI